MNESGAPVSVAVDEVARTVALADVVGLTIRPDDLQAVAQILSGILEAGESLQRDLPVDVLPTDDPHWGTGDLRIRPPLGEESDRLPKPSPWW